MTTRRRADAMRRRLEHPAMRGIVAAAVVWSLAWKGASLRQAAQDRSKPWFVTLLATNTLGVLDAVYLFGVSGARRRASEDEAARLTRTGEPEQHGHSQEP